MRRFLYLLSLYMKSLCNRHSLSMKRSSLSILLLLAVVLPSFAFQDPKYPNLEFTVLDTEAKTVSVKAVDKSNHYTADSILNIPSSATKPATDIAYTVTTVAADGFKGIKIKKITLPSSITTIASRAFRDITTAFTIEISEGLVEIGDRAFCKSTGMQGTLTLPSTLQTVYSSAALLSLSVDTIVCLAETPPTFTISESYKLPDVPFCVPCRTYNKYMEIWGAYTTKINDPCIFSDGTYLYETNEKNTEVSVKKLVDISQTVISFASTEVTHPFNGKSYLITAIADSCFYGKKNITQVVLPSSIKSIGVRAFYTCYALSSLTLNNGLEQIKDRAFCNDTSLVGELTIPSTVNYIESWAFGYCYKVEKFHVTSNTPPTIVENNIFNNKEKPSGIIEIPCGAMDAYMANELWSTIGLQEACDVTFIVDGLRYLITNDVTNEVKLMGQTSTPHAANLVIPTTVPYADEEYKVVSMAPNAFDKDNILTSVVIPSSITEISPFAFNACNSLVSATISEGVESIGEKAFYSCLSLKEVTLSYGLKTIGDRAFCHDSLLSSLTLPYTLQSIEPFAFCNTFSLPSVTLTSPTPPTLGGMAFASNTGKALNYPIYLPCKTMEAYLANDSWAALSARLSDAECSGLTIYHTGSGPDTQFGGGWTGSITYKRKFTPHQWETIYVPFEIGKIYVEDGGELFEIYPWVYLVQSGYFCLGQMNEAGDQLAYSSDIVMQGNKAYIICFDDDYYTDKYIVFTSKLAENELPSTFSAPATGSKYQLVGNTTMMPVAIDGPLFPLNGTQFLLQEEGITLKPFECYIAPKKVSLGAPLARSFAMPRKNDITTGAPIIPKDAMLCMADGNTLHILSNGKPVYIYSISGALIHSFGAGEKEISVEMENGCYLVYSNGISQKVVF